MSHHESQHAHGSEKFVPLTDNNDNLSWIKAGTLIIVIAIVLFGVITLIFKRGGYLQNEQQSEWRVQHNCTFKDSDENRFYKTAEDLKKEEAKEEEMPQTEVKGEEPKAEENKATEAKPEEQKPEAKPATEKKTPARK